MGVTIKDIAKRAGVSVTTVSRALNDYKDIRPETRERILRIAEELNYRPNAVARSLVMKKSQTIGLIISELTRSRTGHDLTFNIICGVNDRATEAGYDLVLSTTDPSRQEQVPYMELCRRRQLDGVILMGMRTDDPYLKEVVESSVPCVLIDVPLVGDKCGHVTLDNERGARMAVEHLIAEGHREIGMINGHAQAFVSLERLNGYRNALKEAGIEYRPEKVYFGDFEEASGREGIRHLLSRFPEMTAVFCASDTMAIGAIRELKDLGRRVPEDISVMGFDDIELASFVTPALSTVSQPVYEFGRKAVDLLIRMFDGEIGTAEVLEPKLEIRESTAPPAL